MHGFRVCETETGRVGHNKKDIQKAQHVPNKIGQTARSLWREKANYQCRESHGNIPPTSRHCKIVRELPSCMQDEESCSCKNPAGVNQDYRSDGLLPCPEMQLWVSPE